MDESQQWGRFGAAIEGLIQAGIAWMTGFPRCECHAPYRAQARAIRAELEAMGRDGELEPEEAARLVAALREHARDLRRGAWARDYEGRSDALRLAFGRSRAEVDALVQARRERDEVLRAWDRARWNPPREAGSAP